MAGFYELFSNQALQEATRNARVEQERRSLAVAPRVNTTAAAQAAARNYLEGSRLQLLEERNAIAEDAYRYYRRQQPWAIGIAAGGLAASVLGEVRNARLRQQNQQTIDAMRAALDDFTARRTPYVAPASPSTAATLTPTPATTQRALSFDVPPESIENAVTYNPPNTLALQPSITERTIAPAAPVFHNPPPSPSPTSSATTVFYDVVPQPQGGQLNPRTRPPYALPPGDVMLYRDLR